MRSVVVVLICEKCDRCVPADPGERLEQMLTRAREGGWDTSADHCPVHNNVRVLRPTGRGEE